MGGARWKPGVAPDHLEPGESRRRELRDAESDHVLVRRETVCPQTAPVLGWVQGSRLKQEPPNAEDGGPRSEGRT